MEINPRPSIWYSVIDNAWLKFIKSCIDPDLYTFVRNPEQDFSEVKYPCASIFVINEKFSKDRYDNRFSVSSQLIPDGAVITKTPASLPYYITYQVEFWSNYRTDMNSMTEKWCALTGRHFSMPLFEMSGDEEVLDEEGNPVPLMCEGEHLKCRVDETDYMNMDKQEQTTRLFHRVYTYRVWADLELPLIQVPVVVELDVGKLPMPENI